MIEIVEGKDAHLSAVVGNLRQMDLDEIKAGCDLHPDDALIESWNQSVRKWAFVDGSKVYGVCGVANHIYLEKVGVPWMLGTHAMDEEVFKYFFLIKTPGFIKDHMMPGYRSLMNFVHSGNTKVIDWLSFCGFTVHDAHPLGKKGEPFHLFSMGI